MRVLRRRFRSAKASRRSKESLAAGGRAEGLMASIRSIIAVSGFGRSGRAWASGAAPPSIRLAVSSREPFQNGCQPASDSQRRTPTAQMSAGGPPDSPCTSRSGWHVGQRSGHVAGCGQRLLLGELGQPEVEQPDRELLALGEQNVRRLDVAVDDPARVRVRERLEDLRAGLDRVGVVQLARSQRLAQRLSGDVLVGDVDVARVALEPVRAEAALVPQPRRGQGFPLGARRGLALARDDLQRHLEARSLVAGEPDRPRAAAAERAQRAIALCYQLARRER